MPRASVVITFHEQPGHLGRCLRALEAAGLDDVEVVLVDNGSRDARTPALLEAWADGATVLRNPVDAGPVAARNQGARAARSPVVVWLDPRAQVRPGWLEPLVLAAAAPGAGAAGPLLLSPDGRVRSAGMGMVGRGRVADLHRGVPGDHPAARTRSLRLVSPAVVAVARDALLAAGGLDLTFGPAVAGLDLCMRLWDSGRGNVVRADSVAVLHGDDPAPDAADEQAFRRRWHETPPDREELLAADGVADAGWADCTWEGPLFDGTPEAAAGRDAVRALAAAGRRPLAREPHGTPLAPGAADGCDEAILTALNRHRVGVPAAQGFRGAAVPAAPGPPRREGIGWLGALLGRSGYAAAGRGVVQAAHRVGLPVLALVTDAAGDCMAPPDLPLTAQDFAPGLAVIHGLPVMPSGIPFWERATAELGLPVVGATCFETEGIPASWVEPCNRVREVWVPSRFNARTFADAGVDPERIHVVPYPVDTDRLRPGRAGGRPPGAPVTFLSVFEWTWRKGWDVLLRAWAEEFAADDPVRLLVVTYRGAGAAGEGGVEEQAVAHLAALGAGPDEVADIELVLDPVPHAAMADLYASADAFVLPTRGEGAGMPVLEAAACGVPVVATAWGGHEELMLPETAFPVAVERMVEAPPALLADNGLYRGLLLAEPSVASLRAGMRAVADDPGAAAARGLRGRAVVEERFSLQATARALDARARALLERRVAVAR
jgi:glycosyltransferase involved in cell wall biosynthesis/GT2 family glycosyltransferase